MRKNLPWVLPAAMLLGMSVKGDVIYNNLTPNNAMAIASQHSGFAGIGVNT